MQRTLLIICAFLAIAAIMILVGAAFVDHLLTAPIHESRYLIADDQDLTEEIAITYARTALMDAGIGKLGMQPAPYWTADPDDPESEKRYFASNSKDRNSGYVHWNIGYGVRIERHEDKIVCKIHRLH